MANPSNCKCLRHQFNIPRHFFDRIRFGLYNWIAEIATVFFEGKVRAIFNSYVQPGTTKHVRQFILRWPAF